MCCWRSRSVSTGLDYCIIRVCVAALLSMRAGYLRGSVKVYVLLSWLGNEKASARRHGRETSVDVLLCTWWDRWPVCSQVLSPLAAETTVGDI